MFKNQRNNMKRGTFLGFVKPCETSMGGEMIELFCLIRLREPLVATTISK